MYKLLYRTVVEIMSKKEEYEKGENENSVDVLIRRFKAGDPEIMYEKIQVSARSTATVLFYSYFSVVLELRKFCVGPCVLVFQTVTVMWVIVVK